VCAKDKTYCVKKHFASIFRTLTPREAEVIKLYYGIDCEKRKTYILYLMSWVYPSIFLIVLIAVAYIGLHVGVVILKRKIYEW
jgi:hypothetical protein